MRKFNLMRCILLVVVALVLNSVSLSQGQTSATPSPAMQDANALMQAQKWAEAAKAFEAITKSEPTNGRAWFQLAMARHSMGEYAKAVDAFMKVPALNTNPTVMYNLACAYSRLKEKDKAFEWLNKAIAAGFAQVNTIKTDEDLTNIRDDERFKGVTDAVAKAATPCMFKSENRQFDFWIGEWDVMNTQGQQVGTSSIQRIVDGCIIFENWTATGGSNIGKSFNFYDPNKNKWRQVWVGNNGQPIDFEGEFKDGAMRYTSVSTGANGQKTLGRMTFFNLGEKVRQLWETSTDDGKTWTVAFDGMYVRKK